MCLQVAGRSKPEEGVEKASETPLHVAVRENQPSSVKALLEHGADTSIQDCRGRTPLNAAISSNRVDVMEIFNDYLGGNAK